MCLKKDFFPHGLKHNLQGAVIAVSYLENISYFILKKKYEILEKSCTSVESNNHLLVHQILRKFGFQDRAVVNELSPPGLHRGKDSVMGRENSEKPPEFSYEEERGIRMVLGRGGEGEVTVKSDRRGGKDGGGDVSSRQSADVVPPLGSAPTVPSPPLNDVSVSPASRASRAPLLPSPLPPPNHTRSTETSHQQVRD